MPTIVEYTDRKNPLNRYPKFIISPTRAGKCCKDKMVEVGKGKEIRVTKIDLAVGTQEAEFGYLRCTVCGFTVKRFSRGAFIAAAENIEDLQRVNWGFQIVSNDNHGSF